MSTSLALIYRLRAPSCTSYFLSVSPYIYSMDERLADEAKWAICSYSSDRMMSSMLTSHPVGSRSLSASVDKHFPLCSDMMQLSKSSYMARLKTNLWIILSNTGMISEKRQSWIAFIYVFSVLWTPQDKCHLDAIYLRQGRIHYNWYLQKPSSRHLNNL